MIKKLILFFLAPLMSSCSIQENSYFPLNSGYKWHYDVRQITRDGLANQKYFLTNLGEGRLNDQPVFLRRSIDGTTLYYSVSSKGIDYLGSSNDHDIEPVFKKDQQIVIRNPLSVNTRWEQVTTTKLLKKTDPPQKIEFKIITEVSLDVTIESMDEVVNVPAGQFEQCMKITMKGSVYKDAGNYVGRTVVSVRQASWYAKGIGLVKMERIEMTRSKVLDKGSLLVELVDFEAG